MDVSDLEYCLSEVGGQGPEDAQACIGVIDEVCSANEGAAAGADCRLREATAWEAIATKRYDDLQSALKPEVADALRAGQEAWSRYRDAQCDATGDFFLQYSGRASADWFALCRRDRTAARAILLDDWLTRSQDFN